jgi:hypothetical protein
MGDVPFLLMEPPRRNQSGGEDPEFMFGYWTPNEEFNLHRCQNKNAL